MKSIKNVVIAQSGGPSPVINNSLRGIIETCKQFPDEFDTIYGAYHGVEGILKEELLNLSVQDEEEISLLRTTPAAGAIGTCRYKIKKNQREDFSRIIDVFKVHNIKYFFYIGGNDSMDTANKISQLANKKGIDLSSIGVAKTIDNDVGDEHFKLVDHTPGYGSVARYWASIIQNINEENRGSYPSDPVIILQVMGRKIGFIPAAARLGDPDRAMPLQIYMPESDLGLDELTDNVNDCLVKHKRVMVVISEGFDVGRLGRLKDSYGHTQYSSSVLTAQQIVVNHLNNVGIKTTGSVRGQTPGTDQRDTMVYASTVDMDEAYKVGKNAVLIARSGETSYMSTIIRRKGLIYSVDYDKVALDIVANSERSFPKEWIASNHIDVTDDFVRYARPLIGDDWVNVPMINGLQRFARLERIFEQQKLPVYAPQAHR
ncbi:MAG: diphosphate--fructose-6-phosphate 1-phosphotransferase [Candidatus Neomarinimicrobiota bacterium]